MLEFTRQLLDSPLFALTLTVGLFLGFNAMYQRGQRHPLLHPLIWSSTAVALVLKGLDIDYRHYFAHTEILMFMLGPATVALAVPLFQQLRRIRSMLMGTLLSTVVGAALATVTAVIMAYLAGANESTLMSLLPKTVTTPISYALAEELGGSGTVAAAAVMVTGLTGVIFGPPIFKWLGIKDERVMGFTLGVVSHGTGTTRAFDISPVAGAFASLGMGLTGAFIAVALPLIVVWFF
ncbi:MAG TPA: LrgB family protein [Pseudomonadales bacterium]|nr:LrgB family protein [Pseudomonadales bacterium]